MQRWKNKLFEFLKEADFAKYEDFIKKHKNGSLFQSLVWRSMRKGQPFNAIIVKDNNENIIGSIAIYVVKKYGKNLLFSPRGPVIDDGDDKTLKELFEGILELSKKYNAYALRFDPLIARDDIIIRKCIEELKGKILFVDDREIDTSPSHIVYLLIIEGKTNEEVFDSFDSQIRYKIRKCEKRNLEIKTGTRDDLKAFHNLFLQTTERKGFHSRPLSYFERLYDNLGDEFVHLKLAYFEGELLGGALLLSYGKTTTYLYGASSEKHRELMPNHLIQWNLIKWAIEKGYSTYSFGGIPGYKDEKNPAYGIYRFKKGFNGYVKEYIGEVNFDFKPLAYTIREKFIPFLRKCFKNK